MGYFISDIRMRYEDKLYGDNTAGNGLQIRTRNNGFEDQ